MEPYEEEFDYNNKPLESCISESLECLNTAFKGYFAIVIKIMAIYTETGMDAILKHLCQWNRRDSRRRRCAVLIESGQHGIIQHAFCSIIDNLLDDGLTMC